MDLNCAQGFFVSVILRKICAQYHIQALRVLLTRYAIINGLGDPEMESVQLRIIAHKANIIYTTVNSFGAR